MKKLLSLVLVLVSSVLFSSAQEIRYFKYSYSVNSKTEDYEDKYSERSSKYYYIICVDSDGRLAHVYGSWSDAQSRTRSYSYPSAFSDKYVKLQNMTDLYTGQPYILSEKYQFYEYDNGYDFYVRMYNRITGFGNSGWNYGEEFFAVGSDDMIIGNKISGTLYWHYYDELDEDEVDELLKKSDENNPYEFDEVYIPDTPSYNDIYDGGSSSGSYPSAAEREEKMYRQQYQKRVELFNSDLNTLRKVQGGSSYVSETTIRSTLSSHQREMRRIRNEAQQKGIYIPQAYEETMSF